MKIKIKILTKQIIFQLLVISIMKSQTSVNYKISMPEPQSHIFEVEAQFENISKKSKEFKVQLPVWRTGRYVLFDFAGDVLTFSASDGNGKNLNWKKIDKTTWIIDLNSSKKINLKYKVYANEFNSRTKGLNSEHGFIDPSAIFVFNEDLRYDPLTLTVAPYKNWIVTTGLDEIEKNKFSAKDYDYFIDCPLEIGTQKGISFLVADKEHKISIFGTGNYNFDTLKKDFTKLIEYNKKFWGKLPYEKYFFMIHISPTGSGATEHINSTIIGTRASVFSTRDSYLNGLLGTVSHEYFHTWNVKQLRPKTLAPYDFLKENYTRELWISEGTTSYYDDLILVRTKFKLVNNYLNDLSTRVRNDRRRPGNLIQSLSESSFDAWIKFWKRTPHSFNFQSDYYEKGASVSLLLDLEIRKITKNKISLDDVMKSMFEKFPLIKGGFTVDDFQKEVENLTNHSFESYFNNYVHGTSPLPWEELLYSAGLSILPKDTVNEVDAGFSIMEQEGKTFVQNVTINSSAMNAGLDLRDEIIALNGERVRSREVLEKIQSLKKLSAIKLTIFRNDQLTEINYTPNYYSTPTYKISKVEKPTELQKKIFETWFDTNW
ncbi:MAG: PDZ domain-containing protein [Bacteroidetes bacterium]|nr:PDZ domain-containing protein [Bacteroidota bacterium]